DGRVRQRFSDEAESFVRAVPLCVREEQDEGPGEEEERADPEEVSQQRAEGLPQELLPQGDEERGENCGGDEYERFGLFCRTALVGLGHVRADSKATKVTGRDRLRHLL